MSHGENLQEDILECTLLHNSKSLAEDGKGKVAQKFETHDY